MHLASGADAIVVLRRGRVAEIGTHEQLVTTRSEYRRLYGNRLPDPPTTPIWPVATP